jgi:hypothetical protein
MELSLWPVHFAPKGSTADRTGNDPLHHGLLRLLNALSAHKEAKLHQLAKDVAASLGMELQSSDTWLRHIKVVKAVSINKGCSYI